MADSKRSHDRVPFAIPVKISKPSPMEGVGIDLGVGGVAVHMAQPVAEGSKVEVDLFGDGETVGGTVRRTAPHPDGGFHVGIQWHEENGHMLAKWQKQAG